MKDIKVAVVGSSEEHWTTEGRVKAIIYIYNLLSDASSSWLYKKAILVSGGCPKGGVDIWAEIIADTLNIEKDIHHPEVHQWDDTPPKKGYRTRNIEIAETCDTLYCIDPKGRITGGARWTMGYTNNLGKPTHLILI